MILRFDPYLVFPPIFLYTFLTPGCKHYVIQQYLTYLCTDINETGPSLVTFLRVDQFYVLRFLFCRVYILTVFWLTVTPGLPINILITSGLPCLAAQCKAVCKNIVNPSKPSGLSHPYQLGESTFSFRGIRRNFSF